MSSRDIRLGSTYASTAPELGKSERKPRLISHLVSEGLKEDYSEAVDANDEFYIMYGRQRRDILRDCHFFNAIYLLQSFDPKCGPTSMGTRKLPHISELNRPFLERYFFVYQCEQDTKPCSYPSSYRQMKAAFSVLKFKSKKVTHLVRIHLLP
eukprot:CAMPEP_0204833624 /NCGR_PEP_ID=MMETSP1346-20131115/17255_1 /ASSEMBLY_ACC=CAM_ASM_000771 /TAXON_ID=215587 /ORGANISM="Aplanochytrium stocchinoi, Strain GSBS06" /LENGTH=152 /DNA_ID=CAMNT_0051966281 /DNA_START=670 /DNA_END=1128 /DNA_ORIENTATION=-